MNDQPHQRSKTPSVQDEVNDRFGVLPNFFRLPSDAPEITKNLWGFAQFGYLDNPLPSLFKERLFVYLSKFCEVRYCISRHVGFLVGLGRPAGDQNCPPETVEQIIRLLGRPLAKGESLDQQIAFCEATAATLSEMPEPESPTEEAIFSCASHVFLQTEDAPRCLQALKSVLDVASHQHLLVFLTFVRTAHFWTKLHPELQLESDITELLGVHEALAQCVLHNSETASSNTTQILLDELVELRREREQAELLRVTLASIGDAVISTNPQGHVTMLNAVAEELTGWTSKEALGMPLETVFQIVNETTRKPVENPAIKALREGVIVGLANHTILIAKNGFERAIDDSAAPIRDANGKVAGSVLIFRDITERRNSERQVEDALSYAESIVDTVREPMLVLTGDLRVRSANRSFYQSFGALPEEIESRPLYDLGNGQWNIPKLRTLLEEILPENKVVHDFEVEHDFLNIGPRTMRLNARKLYRANNHSESILLAIEDITDRKQVQKSERLLASVVESSNDAIISKTLHGVIQSWNTAAERIFGYTAAQAIGRHVSLLIPEERSDEEEQIVERLRAGERVQHFETVRLRSDGRRLHVSLTISPIKDAAGTVIGASKIARDISDRKHAEEAIRTSEARKTAILDTALDGIVTIDHRGVIVDFNPAAEEMFGYSQDDAVGREMAELIIPPGLREQHRKGIDLFLETGEGPILNKRLELSALRSNGKEFPVEVTITRISQSDPSLFTGYIRDIAERKQTEAALTENEQRFRTLVEQVEDYAIFMTDTSGKATSWNEGVRRVLGFSEEEFIGQDIASSIFTPKDVKDGIPQAELDKAAVTGSASDDRWMIRKDGTYFWAAGVTTGLHDERGNLLGFMKVMRDQTERKQMEDELRQYATDLSEADRRKTEFLATLGHELRNPLAPIRTGLEVMKMSTEDPPMIENVRSMMERQVQQMARLIDDLLDVSRITQGKMVLRTRRVTLKEIVQSAVEATRSFIEEGRHDLKIILPEQVTFLNADPTRLTQVFSNILNNSAKYTPAGGQITLACALHDKKVVVSVKDNGLGIPADMLDNIFEMFTQVNRPLEDGYTGLGIGLTLVKRLVKMHGGTIDVQSEGANKGSEFSVCLPILTESSEAEEVPEGPVVSKTLRILVVDDNKAAATMLQMVVEMLGNEVRIAHNGEEAVACAAEFLPDVVLMDIGMPKMNGYEAAKFIRKQPWGNDMLLVALTGWGQDEDKERTTEAGFDHHFVKPTEPAVLQKLLANHQPKSNNA